MTPELARRIAFTLGALLVYRLGSYIPLPGFDAYAAGADNFLVGPVKIFSLSILPYLSAAILIQLASMVSSKLGALPRSGEAGRRKIARYTIGLAVFLTVFQAYGIASSLQNLPNAVSRPGELFVLSTTLTLTGGTMFLIWLSDQITVRGIGNGLALVLSAGIVAGIPHEVASVVEIIRQRALSLEQVSRFAILWVALVGLVVFVELARRRLPVEFAAPNPGGRPPVARSSLLSLKLNSAGFVPVYVAPWLLWLFFLPLTLASMVFGQTLPWLAVAYERIQQLGHWGHSALSSVAIIVFAFIYTAFVVDPEQAADSLRKRGGVIPGIEPGEPTAEHLDHVVSYTTCIGAVYLVAIFLIPEVSITYSQMPFYLGGASVLIVVCTILDIETQVRGQSLTEPGGEQG
jgi:preprotein translocase subunit SecY